MKATANRLLVVLLGIALGSSSAPASSAARAPLPDGLYAEFTTPRGSFVCELHAGRAPLTVANFVALAEGTHPAAPGRRYYERLRWHRVVPGFVIQSGNARAPAEEDLGYSFPDEFVPGLRHDAAGVLSMANAGPDTNASEFFVTLADTTRLDYLHSVFGRVVRGLDVLPAIARDDAVSVRILRIGPAAEAFRADADTFQALAARAPRYSGAPEPAPGAHFDDPDAVLPSDPPRARNFNFKLANFERATGRRIFVRVHASRPGAGAPAARTLAVAHALERDGVAAVYFAAGDEWELWIGDDLLPVFNAEGGREGLHARKQELFRAVRAQAEAYAQQARAARGPGNPLAPADLAKYAVDAMLDALIQLFEPKT